MDGLKLEHERTTDSDGKVTTVLESQSVSEPFVRIAEKLRDSEFVKGVGTDDYMAALSAIKHLGLTVGYDVMTGKTF